MSRRVLLRLVVALGLAPAGCQAVANYPKDRLMDLADIAGFEFYWGQGILAQARATKVVQLGAGAFDGDVMRYAGRRIGVVEEIRAEGGVPLYYFSAYDRLPKEGWCNEAFVKANTGIEDAGQAKYNLTDPDDRGFYEVGGSLALFAGAGVHVDALQFLDFALGWFGVDIGRDDTRNRARRRVENPRYTPIAATPVSEGLQAGF